VWDCKVLIILCPRRKLESRGESGGPSRLE
jgi:hypothetical protein